MNIRFENRNKFTVCGYQTETNSENNGHDLGQLFARHENELREVSESKSRLYGVMWYTDDTHQRYCYLLGIETNKCQGDMVCVEVPAGYFAVASVPKGMTEVEAWTDFFFNEIPALGYLPDEKHGIYFELFSETGDCELWTPVKSAEKYEFIKKINQGIE